MATVAALSVLVPIVDRNSADGLSGVALSPPSWSHPFGTDEIGRDVFVRTFAGGRVDMVVAALTVTWSLVLGTMIGTLGATSARRTVDRGVRLLIDAVTAFPFIILILVLVVIIGPDRRLGFVPAGLPATVAAFVLAGWAYYARLARGEALALRGRDYIVATEVLGYSRWRVLTRHYLPRVIRVGVAYAVADAIVVVVVVASLAFLGGGVQPPTPEWGNLMYEGSAVLQTAWWITVMPGAVLALTGIGVSLIADAALRETT